MKHGIKGVLQLQYIDGKASLSRLLLLLLLLRKNLIFFPENICTQIAYWLHMNIYVHIILSSV